MTGTPHPSPALTPAAASAGPRGAAASRRGHCGPGRGGWEGSSGPRPRPSPGPGALWPRDSRGRGPSRRPGRGERASCTRPTSALGRGRLCPSGGSDPEPLGPPGRVRPGTRVPRHQGRGVGEGRSPRPPLGSRRRPRARNPAAAAAVLGGVLDPRLDPARLLSGSGERPRGTRPGAQGHQPRCWGQRPRAPVSDLSPGGRQVHLRTHWPARTRPALDSSSPPCGPRACGPLSREPRLAPGARGLVPGRRGAGPRGTAGPAAQRAHDQLERRTAVRPGPRVLPEAGETLRLPVGLGTRLPHLEPPRRP